MIDNKEDHIKYILGVRVYCDMSVNDRDKKQLQNMSYDEVVHISGLSEQLLELRLQNERLSEVLREVEEHGVDYVKNKYLNKED